jgi:hypothetical protein
MSALNALEICESGLKSIERVIKDNKILSDNYDLLIRKYNDDIEFKYIPDGNVKKSLPSNINYNDYINYTPSTKRAAIILEERITAALEKDIYHFGDGKQMTGKFYSFSGELQDYPDESKIICTNNPSRYSPACQEWAEGKGYISTNYAARGNLFDHGDCYASCQCMKCGRDSDFHENVQNTLQIALNNIQEKVEAEKPTPPIFQPLGNFVCQDCRNIITAEDIKNSTITISQLNSCKSLIDTKDAKEEEDKAKEEEEAKEEGEKLTAEKDKKKNVVVFAFIFIFIFLFLLILILSL